MTQILEGVYTAPVEVVDKKDGKIHLNIRIHVYNDGTSNNRTNTQSRLDNAEAYQILEKKKDSYENDFTNIARMETYILGEPTPGYHHTLSVYVEGPGTSDDEADRTLGYGIGVGEAGIRSKVQRGLTKIVDKIVAELKAAYKGDKEIVIDLLTVDLFGFSRGAAVARNMIHEALLGSRPLQVRLNEEKYKTYQVDICFVGLYDTVSSHGLFFLFNNDTQVLKLDAISQAEAVLQLVAADEHRKNFSLTDIRSAKVGREIYLPGAHSDIGGSYLDGAVEEQIVYNGFKSDAEQDRAQLIAAGWYHTHEITLEQLANLNESPLPQARVKVRRPRSMHADRDDAARASLVLGGDPIPAPATETVGLPNQYHRIPLQIMARAAREKGIVFNDKLFNKKEVIPEALDGVKERIDNYIASAKGRESRADHWHHNEEWLRQLRHDYLHFSAQIEFGLGPRISKGKRQRMTYAG
ncbi:MAG: DUF2235 domain-containing protein [Pseudomonadota bacterium]|nr:DUF2235 domain-containing protein [Pseudomonadota bacterium]